MKRKAKVAARILAAIMAVSLLQYTAVLADELPQVGEDTFTEGDDASLDDVTDENTEDEAEDNTLENTENNTTDDEDVLEEDELQDSESTKSEDFLEEIEDEETDNYDSAELFDNANILKADETSSMTVAADTNATDSGTCGENLVWEFADGVLIISGTGRMYDYSHPEYNTFRRPWDNWHNDINTVIIQEGVESIGDNAFYNKWLGEGESYFYPNLTEVSIPNSVKSIGYEAFYNCNITSIEIPDSVEKLWGGVFRNCSLLTSVKLPQNLSEISGGLFERCTFLTSIEIPNSVTTIGNRAFANSGMTNIKLPENLTSIETGAFYYCNKLTSIEIPNSVTIIEKGAFEKSGITDIKLPENLTSIEAETFYYCEELTSIEIPDGVTVIGELAFSHCDNLISVTIPQSIIEISQGAFRCFKLSTVYYGGSEDEWKSIKIGINNTHLTNATIHFNNSGTGGSGGGSDTPVKPPITPQQEYRVYCEGGYESFDVSLENCIIKRPSTTYNPQLAHMLMAMCNSVYSESDMSNTFSSFGFMSENTDIDNSQNGIYLTYGMAKKEINGQTLVLIVARGTEGILSMESVSNIVDSGLNSNGQHSGFSDAAQGLYERIQSRLGVTNFADTVFVVTGFSRGAAAANILSAQLMGKGAQQDNVFAYVFACPDIGTAAVNNSYESIFNINNVRDFVSWTPSGWMPGYSNWDKYGKSYWYGENWDNYETLEMGLDAHSQPKYLEYLRQERSISEYKTRNAAKAKLDEATSWRKDKFWDDVKNNFLAFIGIHCPVDVEIYASDGSLVGNIKNNLASSVNTDKMNVSIVGYEKDIYLLDDDTYTFRLAATGDGVMEYTVQNIEVGTKDVVNEQKFANVVLTPGKQFISEVKVEEEIAVDVEMKEVKLYILGDDDIPEKEVLADGNGTEILIKNEGNTDGNKPSSGSGSNPENNKPNSGSNNTDDNDKVQSSYKTSYRRDSDEQVIEDTWKPTTPDEKKRYACMGRDAVQYTLLKDNAYRIVIKNAMQGPQCFKSFEAVLGDYTIGRTYNVYTLPDTVYSMDKEIQFTIKIPSDIYKKGREYKMICVTKGGLPIIYEDIDSVSETITVKTNKFYAYALIYK